MYCVAGKTKRYDLHITPQIIQNPLTTEFFEWVQGLKESHIIIIFTLITRLLAVHHQNKTSINNLLLHFTVNMMGPQRVKNPLLSWPPSIWSKWMYNVKAYHSLHALVLSSNQMQKRYSGHTFFQPSCNPASSFNRPSWTRNTKQPKSRTAALLWVLLISWLLPGKQKIELVCCPTVFPPPPPLAWVEFRRFASASRFLSPLQTSMLLKNKTKRRRI